MTDRVNLDGQEQAVLEEARKGLAPSLADRRRVLSSLGIIGLSGIPTPNPDPQPPASGSSAASASGAGFSGAIVAGGIIAGALLGFGGGLWVGTSSPSTESPLADASESSGRTKDLAPLPHQELKSSGPPADLSVAADEAQRPSSSSGPLKPSPSTDELPAFDKAAEDEVEPTLYQELSYVRQAQAALKRREGAFALGLMRSLDEIRPRGALNAERNVTKVLALCQLNRIEEARTLARQALKSDGTTDIYRRRLAASCARTENELSDESSQGPMKKPESQ